MLKQGAEAEARLDVHAALAMYRKADALQPNDPLIIQKISKQLSDETEDLKTPEQRHQQVEEALKYSERAVSLAPHNAVCLASLAVCYAKLTEGADNATRVEYSRRVKEYAEKAIAADPNYAWGHHVLGVWNYQVAQIGGPLRLAARVFYGGLPAASGTVAVQELAKAVELQPDSPAHRVELGFAYLSCGDKARAATAFREGIKLPSLEKHDESCKARATAALERLGLL